MGQETVLLRSLARSLSVYYSNSDQIVQCVLNHAAGAATAAALSGALPGAGSTIAAGVSIGVIFKMYISLGGMLGIHLGNGVLKAMASAVVADLSGAVAASIAVAAALSFFPGIGSLGAAAITGITSFCYVYLAGTIYIKMVTELLKKNKSIDSMSESELVKELNGAKSSLNMDDLMKEAKTAYKKNC